MNRLKEVEIRFIYPEMAGMTDLEIRFICFELMNYWNKITYCSDVKLN